MDSNFSPKTASGNKCNQKSGTPGGAVDSSSGQDIVFAVVALNTVAQTRRAVARIGEAVRGVEAILDDLESSDEKKLEGAAFWLNAAFAAAREA